MHDFTTIHKTAKGLSLIFTQSDVPHLSRNCSIPRRPVHARSLFDDAVQAFNEPAVASVPMRRHLDVCTVQFDLLVTCAGDMINLRPDYVGRGKGDGDITQCNNHA